MPLPLLWETIQLMVSIVLAAYNIWMWINLCILQFLFKIPNITSVQQFGTNKNWCAHKPMSDWLNKKETFLDKILINFRKQFAHTVVQSQSDAYDTSSPLAIHSHIHFVYMRNKSTAEDCCWERESMESLIEHRL